jgi:hypothetical protein
MDMGLKMVNSIIEGIFIPRALCRHPSLRHENGKANYPAIVILADIAKHAADGELRKNYGEWGEDFALTRNQVKAALDFLVKRRLIWREFRDVVERGTTLRNVPFVGLSGAIELFGERKSKSPATDHVANSNSGRAGSTTSSPSPVVNGKRSLAEHGTSSDRSLFDPD